MIDFSVGSYCSKLAKIDITHYASNFLNWQQQGYNHPTYGGCDWFTDKITYINSLPPTTNTFMLARRKSKIDWCNCMLVQGSCPGTQPVNYFAQNGYRLGCMDDGNMDNSYINNRGTWDFLVQNNTTSSGVVNRPDQTYLTGIRYGSAFPGVQAVNYTADATVDDGSCAYPLETSPGAQDGLPYHRWGCMNSTPDPVGGHPDVNGHGTGATYRCNMSQTNPQTPDACVAPCAPNQGYIKDNYDPCANFSCWDIPLMPLYPPHSFLSWNTYASDYNICHTFWDNTNASTYNWDNTYNAPGMWGPFGNEICCTEPPPQPSNPDITYDFRLGSPALCIGGIGIYSSNSQNSLGFGSVWKIGGQYLRYETSAWDVVGNEQFVSHWDWVENLVYGGTAHNTWTLETINIKIYDIYKNLIGDWDYTFLPQLMSGCPIHNASNTLCWDKTQILTLTQENFSINPGQIVDLEPYTMLILPGQAVVYAYQPIPHPWTILFQGGYSNTYSPVAYVQINSHISGTTVDTVNTGPCTGFPGTNCAPRIASTHWTTPRGNTANLTNMWTGQNLNAHPVTNPFPALGWTLPHSCHDCGVSQSSRIHWLEPGPNDPTPGDYFYNNPNYITTPSSVHATWSAAGNCRGGRIVGSGTESIEGHKQFSPCSESILINTKITYSEDENQEVIITPSNVDATTPISTQTATPPPTTPIPPPTTPTPPPTTGSSGSMSGGY